MASRTGSDAGTVVAPPHAKLRALFAASAEALLAHRPLRGNSTPALEPQHALTRDELAALGAVGLSTAAWSTNETDDPLAQTVVDYMALIETSLGTTEVAQMLGVDASRVRQRLREGSLCGVEYEGEWHLPKFQFERRKVLPGLATVLGAVPSGANALEVAAWILSPNIDLVADEAERPLSPRAWLLRGGSPERVAALARDL